MPNRYSKKCMEIMMSGDHKLERFMLCVIKFVSMIMFIFSTIMVFMAFTLTAFMQLHFYQYWTLLLLYIGCVTFETKLILWTIFICHFELFIYLNFFYLNYLFEHLFVLFVLFVTIYLLNILFEHLFELFIWTIYLWTIFISIISHIILKWVFEC